MRGRPICEYIRYTADQTMELFIFLQATSTFYVIYVYDGNNKVCNCCVLGHAMQSLDVKYISYYRFYIGNNTKKSL